MRGKTQKTICKSLCTAVKDIRIFNKVLQPRKITRDRKMNRLKILIAGIVLALFTVTAYAAERFNFGEHWTASTIPEKMLFMQGYQAGYIIGAMHATRSLMPIATEEEKQAAFNKAATIYNQRRFANDMLASILVMMDRLYENPENHYIDRGIMLELAIDKLQGRNIEEDLLFQRKAAAEDSKQEK